MPWTAFTRMNALQLDRDARFTDPALLLYLFLFIYLLFGLLFHFFC